MHDDGLDNDDEGISRVLSGSLLERVWDPQLQHDLQQAYVRLGAISALRNQIYLTWGTELDLSHALYPYPDGTGGDRIADSLLAACTAIEAGTTRLHTRILLGPWFSAGSTQAPHNSQQSLRSRYSRTTGSRRSSARRSARRTFTGTPSWRIIIRKCRSHPLLLWHCDLGMSDIFVCRGWVQAVTVRFSWLWIY